MNAVITTGGRVDGSYAAMAGTEVKALAMIRGTSMLDRTLESLAELGVDRIAVVGGDAVRRACGERVQRFVNERASGAENVVAALRAWPNDEPLLYLTSDMPYVNGAALRDFCARVPQNALGLPLVERADFVRRFPESPPFGITLAGECVVNGGAFAIPAGGAERVEAIATRLFDARKAPWRMVGLVGPAFLLRFALGRLSISALEAHAEKLLGFAAVGVRNCAPELGYDADTAGEYAYAADRA